jgi:hypothetical protein
MQPILQLRSDDVRTLWVSMYTCVSFAGVRAFNRNNRNDRGTIQALVTHSEAASTSNPKPEAGS